MAIKETVLLLLLVILPVSMEVKEPAKPGGKYELEMKTPEIRLKQAYKRVPGR